MPGTGKHGYTGPALYGGSYNISNGIIQSGSPAVNTGVVNRNSPFGGTSPSSLSRGIASSVADIAGTDPSDFGSSIRDLLEISANNTAQSQAFAREQMEYQRQSDATAMAWSAQEAQKNRDWQERLSNSAHQREVDDLLKAGLNPILSANNGAYTGSGATGQGFSSSGAMGQVDTSGTAALGSLIATSMNTASQAAIAQMYTDAEKYNTDLQYAASKMATEASIMNNQNTTSAQKQIAYAGFANDLDKVNLQGQYGLSEATIHETGANYREVLDQTGQDRRQDKEHQYQNYSREDTQKHDLTKQQREYKNRMEELDRQLSNGSVTSIGAIKEVANVIADTLLGTHNSDFSRFWNRSSGKTINNGGGATKRFGNTYGWG